MPDMAASVQRSLALQQVSDFIASDITGRVASLTESELDAVGDRTYTASLVNRDSAPRRAWRWDVQSDVGELSLGS
jgi:hypothetical protein